MNKDKTYKCDKCKQIVPERDFLNSYGMCDSCYAETWDEGFSSQADYSDMMYERDMEIKRKHNELLNKEVIKDKDILYFIDNYWTGTVYCSKCQKRRISSNKFEKLRKEGLLLQEVKKDCPSCGVKGFIYFG